MLLDPIPSDFKPRFFVAGVHVVQEGKLLLLRRHLDKPEGGTWCVPGGKKDGDRRLVDTAIRELFEETGIVASRNMMIGRATFAVRYDTYDFWYRIYRYYLVEIPDLVLRELEHTGHTWATPSDALKMDLIEDEDEIIRRLFQLQPA